jgi:hypothetical protein
VKTALSAPGTTDRTEEPLPVKQPEQLTALLLDFGRDDDGGREERVVSRRRKPDLRRRYQAEHDERTRDMAARLHSGLHFGLH